jgi:DNA-binding NtrC family response regulator
LSDFDLGDGMNGNEMLRRLIKSEPSTKSILMSGKSSVKTTALDGIDFIEKPVTFEKLEFVLTKTPA